jgi:hypothetical protein
MSRPLDPSRHTFQIPTLLKSRSQLLVPWTSTHLGAFRLESPKSREELQKRAEELNKDK